MVVDGFERHSRDVGNDRCRRVCPATDKQSVDLGRVVVVVDDRFSRRGDDRRLCISSRDGYGTII